MKDSIFGVRHLSPTASWHLLNFLNERKPHCVLIEGPSDATELLHNLADTRITPPVALLAYTCELPIRTVLYPFADYSPEYQAIRWAAEHNAEVRFIDLPTEVSLAFREQMPDGNDEARRNFYAYSDCLYEQLAHHYREADYESYWERNFEHNLEPQAFRNAVLLQSSEMRQLSEHKEQDADTAQYAYNLVREAYMRRCLTHAVADGYAPADIAVIIGAYHAPALTEELPPMSDAELHGLPRVETRTTLMPYSYLRLSSRTGYGAGNKAPYYFELMWHCMTRQQQRQLPALYLSQVAAALRKEGWNASSASVIEAVRLAESLASIHQGNMPVLEDLHDAAITCLGGGDLSVVAEAVNRCDIGTAIGNLPEGVSQTPVQDDMNRQLKRLKLLPYKSPVAQSVSLDLRENFRVKSEEAAFTDLRRSTFFHRLKLLNIHFVTLIPGKQQGATWAENWSLQWSPEVEIEVVEATLKGETIEIAAAFQLNKLLEESVGIEQTTTLLRTACECALTENYAHALAAVQVQAVEASSFGEVAGAAYQLSQLIQYGTLRRIDIQPLEPLLEQLFLRGALLLTDAAACDARAAKVVAGGINLMELIAQEQDERVDVKTWQSKLLKLAFADDRNAYLSGLAFAIALEHGWVDDGACAKEVSLRLSVGVPADLGAAWFEGLAGRNRYALLSRITLWKELDNYVQSLDETEFYRAAVFLRRAFGEFEPSQKNSIYELLSGLWGSDAAETAEAIAEALDENEEEKLQNLNDFEFDF
ncbi:MAG: DUF5682 family protein [Mediterranea sp.]|jgi:hypothetical protein|nr:DUF5682 family protein [Mediterranea sp.]